MPDVTTTTISKLQKKEIFGRNIFTVALLGGLGLTAFYFWALIVPFVLAAMANTLELIGLIAAIVAIGYVVFDPQMRTLAAYAYRSLTRFITGQFVELDPIGILNTYVERIKERLADMDKGLGILRGQRDHLSAQINTNEENRVHNLELAQQAQKRGDAMRQEMTLKARQAGRLEKSNLKLKDLLERVETLYRTMSKMREASALLAQDIEGEVEVKTTERKALLAGYTAFTKARAIMDGGGAERDLFDLTMEKLTDDYANKMGEIEQFLDMSKSFINGMDLDNGIYEEKALAQLQEWEQKGSSLLSTPPPGTPKVRVQGDFADILEDTGSHNHQGRA
jgi:hypothetical protein